MQEPSSRELLSDRIANWISERSDTFSAPIVRGLFPREDGPGFGRFIKFGIHRMNEQVEFQLVIWKENRLDVQSSLIPDEWVHLNSEAEFYQFCIATTDCKP